MEGVGDSISPRTVVSKKYPHHHHSNAHHSIPTPPSERVDTQVRNGRDIRIQGKKATAITPALPALKHYGISPSTSGIVSTSSYQELASPNVTLAEKMKYQLSSLVKMNVATKEFMDGLLDECAQIQSLQERNQILEEKLSHADHTIKQLQESVIQLSSQKQQLSSMFNQDHLNRRVYDDPVMRSQRAISNSPPKRNHFSVIGTGASTPVGYGGATHSSPNANDNYSPQALQLMKLLTPTVMNPQQSLTVLRTFIADIFGAESVNIYFLDQRGEKLIHNPFVKDLQDAISIHKQRDKCISWYSLSNDVVCHINSGERPSDGSVKAMFNPSIDASLGSKAQPRNLISRPFSLNHTGDPSRSMRAVCVVANRTTTITSKMAESLLGTLLESASTHLSVCVELALHQSSQQSLQDTHEPEKTVSSSQQKLPSPLNRSTAEDIDGSNPSQVLLEMARDITNELDLLTLLRVMMDHAKELVHADRCSVFLVDQDHNEIVSKVADGVADEIRFPKTTGIAGHVACTGECVIVNDVQSDGRFNAAVDKQTGYKTTNMLCVPIANNGEIVGVTQMINKRNGRFSLSDQRLISTFSVFCGIGIRNATLYEEALKQQTRTKSLLEVAMALSSLDDLNSVVQLIMSHAQTLVDAERFCLFEVDQEDAVLRSRVADGHDKIILPLTKGVAGYVVKTKESIIVDDPYEDTRFHKEIDKLTGFTTTSLVCLPILNRDGNVIGVVEMINKRNGDKFKKEDLDLLKAFASFCALSLDSSTTSAKRPGRLQVMPTGNIELDQLRMTYYVPSDSIQLISRTDFKCWEYTHQELVGMIVYMFMDLGLVDRFRIPEVNLYRFVRACQKVYRTDVPYHNFVHAFDVTHCTYLFLKMGNMSRFLNELDILGLMVASVCHDLDHR
eukprot:TRINITY_DN7173_c1_g1_i1.p1 TRINITY_DN7173_c1_g1~~TRINITY_DN7173_c1_g1_i1.p1  ORF type:complete len:902 (+),score=163.63 TRINITY_DN7173_c1_g1_i1:68-2773(+)